MPFKDLREFIAKLEKESETVRIEEEVDWNLEAGAIVRRSCEKRLPAPFFQKVKGYPKGYRLIGGTASNYRRIAMAWDMEPDTPHMELMDEFIRRREKTIPPVLVKDGPCKENIHIRDEVDLLKFPVPMIHDGDGGRYLGTWHTTIVKDLDSDWVNWSMQRHMLHSKNSFGILADPSTHLGSLYTHKYEPRNKAMEVAVVIGTEPVTSLCSAMYIPYGVSEVDIVGAVRRQPVELIKCETVDLAVPATAEIVIEGEMRPHERMDEGPFGEFAGYSASIKVPRPVIHVRAVTHRNNPIFTMSCPGIPVDDDLIWTLAKSALIMEALRKRGLPITAVHLPAEAASLLAVVSVKTANYANVADDIAHVIWGLPVGRHVPYIIVVDDDVDPFNMSEWLHALVSKCNPGNGIVIQTHGTGSPLMPFLNRHDRLYRMGAKAYFDCTWPLDWAPEDVPQRSSFTNIYPSEIQKKALAKLSKYGY